MGIFQRPYILKQQQFKYLFLYKHLDTYPDCELLQVQGNKNTEFDPEL